MIAYCIFFACSADYILGFTGIRKTDIEARGMCKLTGLPEEEAILELIELNQEELRPVQGCRAMLIKSKLFYTLLEDIVAMGNELRLMYQHEAEVQMPEWERGELEGFYLMDSKFDIGEKREEIESRRAVAYGLLAKTSGNLEETVEDDKKNKFCLV